MKAVRTLGQMSQAYLNLLYRFDLLLYDLKHVLVAHDTVHIRIMHVYLADRPVNLAVDFLVNIFLKLILEGVGPLLLVPAGQPVYSYRVGPNIYLVL